MKSIILEFFRADGTPLRIIDAGSAFIQGSRIPLTNVERPIRLEATGPTRGTDPAESLRTPAAIPLLDGRHTAIRVTGNSLPLEGKSLSARVVVVVEGEEYELMVGVTTYLKRISDSESPVSSPSIQNPPPRQDLSQSTAALESESPKCPMCAREMRKVRFRVGSGYNEFLGCSGYPRCKYNRSLKAR